MKKIISLLLMIAFAATLLSSCGVPEGNINTTTADDPITTRPLNSTEKYHKRYELSPFLSDDVPDSVSTEAVIAYLSGNSVEESLAALYSDSDEVVPIPIFGRYLDKTSLLFCVFKKQSEPVGSAILVIDSGGNIVSECDYVSDDIHLPDVSAKKWNDNAYRYYLEDVSFFGSNIVGVSYTGQWLFIGTENDDETVLRNPLYSEFGYIDPFTSIEEGREKYDVYFAFREEQVAQLPIYEWKEANLSSTGYMRLFEHRDKSYDEDGRTFPYLGDYDWYINVPLLDSKGRENVYVLQLLYQKQTLIAELLLENDTSGETSVYRARMERVSEKDPQTGEYIGLNNSYLEKCDQLLANGNENVKGIAFDGKDYRVIYNKEPLDIAAVVLVAACAVVVVGIGTVLLIVKRRKKKTDA